MTHSSQIYGAKIYKYTVIWLNKHTLLTFNAFRGQKQPSMSHLWLKANIHDILQKQPSYLKFYMRQLENQYRFPNTLSFNKTYMPKCTSRVLKGCFRYLGDYYSDLNHLRLVRSDIRVHSKIITVIGVVCKVMFVLE